MKSPSIESPQISCRLIRVASIYRSGDVSTGQAPDTQAHVRSCASCQDYFSARGALDFALRAGASGQRVTPDSQFANSIKRAVHAAAAAPNGASRRRALWPAFGLASGAAALILAFAIRPKPAATPHASASSVIAGEPVLLTFDDVQKLPATLRSVVPPAAGALLQQDPLQQEVNAVYADARAAWRFLEANFTTGDGFSAPAPARSS